MAFKVRSKEVITNNLEIKGKRAAGRLGKVRYDPVSNPSLVGFDVSTGNHFVIDYEEIVLNPNFISGGYTAMRMYVINRPADGGQSNQVPGDYPNNNANPVTFGSGIADCWEFTLLIKNLYSPKVTSKKEIHGQGSYFVLTQESPGVASSTGSQIELDAYFINDRSLRHKYGSDIIFKIMKAPNMYPGGGSSYNSAWQAYWQIYPMMRNLF